MKTKFGGLWVIRWSIPILCQLSFIWPWCLGILHHDPYGQKAQELLLRVAIKLWQEMRPTFGWITLRDFPWCTVRHVAADILTRIWICDPECRQVNHGISMLQWFGKSQSIKPFCRAAHPSPRHCLQNVSAEEATQLSHLIKVCSKCS